MKRSKSFAGERQSVSAARRFVTEALVGTAEDVLQAVELMVSELATNCVRHVRTGFDLTVQRVPEEIRVEVTDYGLGEPQMRNPSPEEPTGRGLMIVDMLSERWGVEHEPSGKTVWFTLAASAEAGRPVRASQRHTDPGAASTGRAQSPPARAGCGDPASHHSGRPQAGHERRHVSLPHAVNGSCDRIPESSNSR